MEIKLAKRWKKLILLTVILSCLPLYVVTTNLYLAMQRGDQKRNLADMRAIGTAVEAYAVDHQIYPPGNSTVAAISHYIEPLYIKSAPKKDSWGNLFLYQTSSDGLSYTITSYGKDHMPDSPGHYKGVIARFTNDITFSQGSFTAFPIGI